MAVHIVHIEPPTCQLQDLEDFLATDDLFVEYFNAFLSLPTFPVPLCFNKETGGFEVVSEAKKDLAQQIKAAIRSQQKPSKIYDVTQLHSFSNVSPIPMEPPDGPEKLEINTDFMVTTLNREQGIQWIKAERLPAFLDSNCYVEYRLSRLIAQAKVTSDQGEYLVMKIDNSPVVEIKKRPDEEDMDENHVETLMKNLFVCMGMTKTTDTENWFSSAHSALSTNTSFVLNSRPRSAVDSGQKKSWAMSARPTSAVSFGGKCSRPDSGFDSSYASNMSELAEDSIKSQDDDMESDQDMKSIGPRLSENVCFMAPESIRNVTGSRVFYLPSTKYDITDTESGLGDIDTDDGNSVSEISDNRPISNSVASDNSENAFKRKIIQVKNINDLGAVIVGTVLKRSISRFTKYKEELLQNNPAIKSIFPNDALSNLTVDELDNIYVQQVDNDEKRNSTTDTPCKPDPSNETEASTKDESDVDSLLDSSDDYEDGDDIFRKHKIRRYTLMTRKGIDSFRKFLRGTNGEKNWNFWLDIDRCRLLKDYNSQQQFISTMRERYHVPGSVYELPAEFKQILGLDDTSNWNPRKLMSVQNKVVEPILLYWAPRFLLKQMMRINPDKYYMYQHQRLLRPRINAYPTEKSASLLPLRPKSCMPRFKHREVVPTIQMPKPAKRNEYPITTPVTGSRRKYYSQTMADVSSNKTKTSRIKAMVKVTPKPKITQQKKELLNLDLTTNASTSRSHIKVKRPDSAGSERSIMKTSTTTSKVRSKSATVQRSSDHDCESMSDVSSISSDGNGGTAPSISGVSKKSSVNTKKSEFFGGHRMELLLQALLHEQSSGGFFSRYVRKTKNMVWMNCIRFWNDLQDYHAFFFADSMDPLRVTKKAQAIYSQYIVISAPHDINCSLDIRMEVSQHLHPPFEDLFDVAEEYVFTILYVAWMQMLSMDKENYKKIELIEVKRKLETKSKCFLHLRRRGFIKEKSKPIEDAMDGYLDPVYDPTLMDKIPDEFKEFSLEKLVHNRMELEQFRQFLAENYSSMDLMCWMDIETFRRIPPNEDKRRDNKAKDLKVKYLNKKYFFGPNSPAGKEGQDKVMLAGGGWGKLLLDRPPNPMLLEAQKFVLARLEKKWLPLFLATPEFATRQRPHTRMDDVVDDVLIQRHKRSQAVWKMLESRWVSSSKEIITFRKALLNPVTSKQFRRFISIKGDSLENDVLFWQEVQKYKDLYHVHNEDGLIQQKINAIINIFVDSQIPPSIQIDIPTEMADRIIDRRLEKGPYLFREAQLAVFRVLSAQWNAFCEFRTNLADDKIMTTIERRRKHVKSRERVKQRESDLLREKEGGWKSGSMFGDSDDEVDGDHDPFKEGSQTDELYTLDKEKLSWTYSTYLSALEKEEILNNFDEESFSSFTDTATIDREDTIVGDNASEITKQAENTKNAGKRMKTEECQTDPKKDSKIITTEKGYRNTKRLDENEILDSTTVKTEENTLSSRNVPDKQRTSKIAESPKQQLPGISEEDAILPNLKMMSAPLRMESRRIARHMPPLAHNKK